MAYTSHAIANEFLRLTRQQGKQLTNMQLQKLVFLAQGYALAIEGDPLHKHNTRAWQWGQLFLSCIRTRLEKSCMRESSG